MRSHGHPEKNQKNKRHLRLLYFLFGFSAGQKKSLSRLSFFPLHHQIFNLTSFIHLLSIFFSLFTGFLYTVTPPLYSLFPLFYLFDLIHPPDLGRTLYSYSFVSRELGLRSSCRRKGPLSSLVAKSTLVASVVTRPHTKSALKESFLPIIEFATWWRDAGFAIISFFSKTYNLACNCTGSPGRRDTTQLVRSLVSLKVITTKPNY